MGCGGIRSWAWGLVEALWAWGGKDDGQSSKRRDARRGWIRDMKSLGPCLKVVPIFGRELVFNKSSMPGDDVFTSREIITMITPDDFRIAKENARSRPWS